MPIDAPPDQPALALAVAALTGLRGMRLISHRTVCHGYANVCVCDDCLKRASGDVEQPKRIRQPWETEA